MSDQPKTVSVAPEAVVGRGVDNVAAVGTNLIGVFVPGVSSEPSKTEKTEETKDEEKKEDKPA